MLHQEKLRQLKALSTLLRVAFQIEKAFTVDAVVNCCNDWHIAQARSEIKGIFKTKNPVQVMVFGVVASDGKKMPLNFFKPGEKVNTKVYYKVLRFLLIVLPWLKANYPTGNYVLTQDGAPAHIARKVQKFYNDNFADFCQLLAIVQSRPEPPGLCNLGHITALNQHYFAP